MSTFRFDLPERPDLNKIYHWMNQHVGTQQEGVTWFWSTRTFWYNDDQGRCVEGHKEGVKIWSEGPVRFLAAVAWAA